MKEEYSQKITALEELKTTMSAELAKKEVEH